MRHQAVNRILLERVPTRVSEIAIRMALGATASRIVRQLTFEGLLLAGIAAVPGVVLAQLLNRLIPTVLANVSVAGADVQRVQATVDWRVLAFAIGAAVITGVIPTAVAVSPVYFAVEQIPVLVGRGFGDADDHGPPVAVVDRAFADRYLTGSPLGQILWTCPRARPRIVIGVVADRPSNPRLPAAPTVYLPLAQAGAMATGTTLSFAVRTHGPAFAEMLGLQHAFEQIAPDLPLFDVETGVRRVDRLLAFEQTVSRLLILLGSVAVVLSGIGLYGVLAYTVRRRTAEVGLRVAVGATPGAVVVLVIGESLRPVAIGLVAGAGLSVAASRSVAGLLYGVSPLDPVTIGAACTLFIAASLVAAAVPALRAARINPTRALRVE